MVFGMVLCAADKSSNSNGGFMVVGVCCGVSRLINLSLDIDKLEVSC